MSERAVAAGRCGRSSARSSVGRWRPTSSRRRCSRRRWRCRSSRPTRSPRSPTQRSRRSSSSSRRRPRPRYLVFPISLAHCGAAGDRRRLLPADRSRLRDERRRLHRREGESRHAAEPRRGRGAAHRLRADGRGLDRRRGLRGDVVRAVARGPQGRALARLSRRDRLRQPAWRARVGACLRAADLRVRRGDVRCWSGSGLSRPSSARRPRPWSRIRSRQAPGGVTLFVLLRAFSSGSTALTGVEAIANGVNAFRRPHGKNAATTLAVLGGDRDHALPRRLLSGGSGARPAERHRLGRSPRSRARPSPPARPASFMYYAVQALTLGVLVLAANTSFQGFPRLAALLARDGFAPRQFMNLGDRLVFSNGMLVLAVLAGLLLWVFGADVNSLIHLYVIGVFTAFTLSQAGMVRYWKRMRGPRWRYRALVNGVGATATGVVAAVVIVDQVRRRCLDRDGGDPGPGSDLVRNPPPLPGDRSGGSRQARPRWSLPRHRATRPCCWSSRSTRRPAMPSGSPRPRARSGIAPSTSRRAARIPGSSPVGSGSPTSAPSWKCSTARSA